MSGDKNTRFFHNSVKGRKNLNRILMLLDDLRVEHFSEASKGDIAVNFSENSLRVATPLTLKAFLKVLKAEYLLR